MSAVSRGVGSVAGSMAGGVLLLAAGAAWTVVAALGAGGSPVSTTALVLAAAATLAVAWLTAARRPSLVLMGVIGVAAALFVADAGATLRTSPTQGPFGYANATAAFYAQASVAAVLLVIAGRGALRAVGVVAAVGFAPLVIVSRSTTVMILLPLALVVALVVERAAGGRAAVAVCGALFVVTLVASIALGAWGGRSGPGPFDRLIAGTISQERVVLWNDALSLTARHPLLGVGPGRFADESAIAAADPDLRWAHNEFLQAGAETGLPGYVLAVGVFLWGFAALWQGSPGRSAAVAAAGLATLGIQASVDYVLHFPYVVLAGAAVLGAALGASRGHPGTAPAFVAGTPVRGPA